jgi:phosphatidylglycerol:prolipoprotein diacylglycerol transferase
VWPIVYDFGTYELGAYGVLVGLAVLLGLWVVRHLGARDGLPPKAVNDAGLGTLFAGFVGSAALGVFVALASGAGLTVADFRSAGAVHGGLLAAMPAGYFLARHFKLSIPLLWDAYMPAAALGQGIGRLGCFSAGCCFGTHSDAPWAVTFLSERAHQLGGVPLHVSLHPVQLYDALAHFLIFGVLFALHKKKLFVGRLFAVGVIAEGVTRIVMETFRGDLGRGVWLNISWLSTGRLTALLLIGLGFVVMFLQRKTAALDSDAASNSDAPQAH